jgi:hypothetical protein
MPVTDLASLASEVGLPAEELARECDPDGQELSELFAAFGVQAMAVKMVVKAQLRTCRAQMSGGGGGDPGNAQMTGGGGDQQQAVQVQLPDGSSYTLNNPTQLTNQDYVRRMLDQVKIGLGALVDFTCRTRGLQPPTTSDAMYLMKHIKDNVPHYAASLGVDVARMTGWVREHIESDGPVASRRGLLPLRHAVSHQLKDRYTHQEVAAAIVSAEALCTVIVGAADQPTRTAAGAAVHNLGQLRQQFEAQPAAGAELPQGWAQYYDKREGDGTFDAFYVHLATGRSQWERPAQAAHAPPPPEAQAPVVKKETMWRRQVEFDHTVVRAGLLTPDGGSSPEFCLLLATPAPRLLRRPRGAGSTVGELTLMDAQADSAETTLRIRPAGGAQLFFEAADAAEAHGWRTDVLRVVGEDARRRQLGKEAARVRLF